MDSVVKVGGSLAVEPEVLKRLCTTLSRSAAEQALTVVPGGGEFADTIRAVSARFCLPEMISHRMAILAMDQYGLMLSHLIPNSVICSNLTKAKLIPKANCVAVFLPSRLLQLHDPFEPSWDVTSDSIAAYVADKLCASRLVLVTNVDGVFSENPAETLSAKLLPEVSVDDLLAMEKRSSVDKVLPNMLRKTGLDCYVVNGKYPERVEAVLSGKPTICTKIVN